MDQPNESLERYSRQMRFSAIGTSGQQKLASSRVLLVGCGALGSVIANTLVRAGVGFLRLVDRDFLEISNLQRQVLYTESDVASGLPKAVVAANRLRDINSHVATEPIVADVTPGNIESLCDSIDLILDGTDNFEIRFLMNDVSVKLGIPWIYGGCLGADGQSMTILPGTSACLNCLMLNGPPPPGTTETCDSFGILSPIINLIASVESIEAIKILTGNREAVSRKLQVFSMWSSDSRQVDLSSLRDRVDCPTCKQKSFAWLAGKRGSQAEVLCGRDAVQLSFADRKKVNLVELAKRLGESGEVQANEFLVRFSYQGYRLTVFEDGRAIVSGTDDPIVARKLYAQFIGQ